MRPREWDRAALLEELWQYIDSHDIPIIAEFASLCGLHRQQLYDMPELSDALKVCTSKKEGALESKALKGDINCPMAIFSLKQLGWSDRTEQTLRGDAKAPLVISSKDADL